jgi:predicted ester cyclase
MTEKYPTILHRWFEEVWNQKRDDTIGEMLAEGTVLHGLNDEEGNPLVGPEGFKTMHFAFTAALGDLHVTIEDTIIEGDKIDVRCRVRATHTGEGLRLTPTNRAVEFTGMGIARVADGKMVEVWNEWDFLKMYAQLDALSLNLK